MAGGGGTSTSQQTIPDWMKPFLSQELGAAGALTPGMYGGSPSASSLVAPVNQAEQTGLSSMINASGQGAGMADSAAAANQFETSGALLNPASNPYLQNTFNLAANSVQNQLATEFAGNGSNVINSLPVQSDEMNNLATQLYGGQYDAGLQAMTQASAMSPNIQQGLYMPGQQLYGAGQTQQQQAQNVINAPYNALSWYSGLLGLNGSSLGGSTQSNNPNAATQDAGLGLSALGTAAEIAYLY